MDVSELAPYFSGERLWGDDFEQDQLDEWFEDETEGYADVMRRPDGRLSETYPWRALNVSHGYRHLPPGEFRHVLCFGGAHGLELLPVIDRVRRITVLEPSEAFVRDAIGGVPCEYVRPVSSGVLPFADESFDLITCHGTLHHIANVTFVASEMSRVLASGGHALVREPITAMGDWTKPRPAATKRERGIPLAYMDRLLHKAGLTVLRKRLCVFPPISRVCNKLGIAAYDHRLLVALDRLACAVTAARSARYWRTGFQQKLAPGAVHYVLTKNSPP